MQDRGLNQANRRLVLVLGGVVMAMFGFGFALVPLYYVFCDITGLNGRLENTPAEAIPQEVDTSRTVTLEFVSNVNGDLVGWEFKPTVSKLKVHPGQLYETTFYARNSTGKRTVCQAVPSITPGYAKDYLNKTECFCFTQQEFEAWEGREMPLRFVISPALPKDVTTMTLSYTFFDISNNVAAR